MSGKGGGGDRNVKMMMVTLTVNFILMIFYLALYGINGAVFSFVIPIPNTQFGLPVSFTFVTLVAVFIGLIITSIAIAFLIQLITGASFLGSGAGHIGGTITLMLIQFFPLILLYVFTAIFATALLLLIPFGLGLILQVVLGIIFLVGLLLHPKAAGT